MKARPKTTAMFQVLNWKFLIMLKPQQKWDVEEEDGEMRLKRDNITMNLSTNEFDKYFKLIDSDENTKHTKSGCVCENCEK